MDAFLLEPKHLRGGHPVWQQSEHRARELHATWGIEDTLGIERAALRFRCYSDDRLYPSLSLIFRSKPIWRVDIVRATERKFNPPWARTQGLPFEVIGPHEHGWPDNKPHLLREHTIWEIPSRRPLPVNVRRLPQVLPWLSERINLGLSLTKGGLISPHKPTYSNGDSDVKRARPCVSN